MRRWNEEATMIGALASPSFRLADQGLALTLCSGFRQCGLFPIREGGQTEWCICWTFPIVLASCWFFGNHCTGGLSVFRQSQRWRETGCRCPPPLRATNAPFRFVGNGWRCVAKMVVIVKASGGSGEQDGKTESPSRQSAHWRDSPSSVPPALAGATPNSRPLNSDQFGPNIQSIKLLFLRREITCNRFHAVLWKKNTIHACVWFFYIFAACFPRKTDVL